MNDPHNLRRFVDAQLPVYDQVRAELRSGQKESHWIWFIFPQLRGLGHSPTAIRFGLASRQEAEEYLNHPILGVRLQECTGLVNSMEDRSIREILGSPDDLKFRSCMTLFAAVAPDNQLFKDALQKYFAGEPDPVTIERL